MGRPIYLVHLNFNTSKLQHINTLPPLPLRGSEQRSQPDEDNVKRVKELQNEKMKQSRFHAQERADLKKESVFENHFTGDQEKGEIS